jgi:O-antigen/teichoic acid export membrane protein
MLIKHSMVYVPAKLVPGIIGMLTTAALTRLLTPAEYGIYGLALVVMTFGSTLAFDWLGVSFQRVYYAGRHDPRLTSTFVQIFLILMCLTGTLALLAWGLGLFTGSTAPSYAIGLVMTWAYAWFELAARFEVANFRPGRYLRMNLARALFILLGAVGAAWLTRSPIWTAAGTATGILAGALLGGFSGWGFGRRHFDVKLARTVLTFGMPMAASMALSSLIGSGTRAMVEWMGSAEALGYYTAAFMLVQNTLNVAAAGIAAASYALAVKAVESGDEAAARRQLLANGSLLLAVMAPAALGMALTAHGIAVTLVGPRYVQAVTTLTPWMAGGAFFANLRANYLDHAFQLSRRPTLQIQVTALAAVLALGLSYWLIPLMGPLGTAIAVAVAMAVSCVHAALIGRWAYPVPMPLDAAWRVGLACLAMTICVLIIPGRGTASFLLQASAGALAYCGVGAALNLLGARDSIRALLRRAGVAPVVVE